jgi:hypothetical protein
MFNVYQCIEHLLIIYKTAPLLHTHKKNFVQVSMFLKLLESKTHFDKFLTFIFDQKKKKTKSVSALQGKVISLLAPGILLKHTLNFKYKPDKKCMLIVPGTQEVVES